MKRILVLSDWFDPAFKAGGPIRSCVNFVSHMHNEFELYVLAGSYDLNSSSPLPVKINEWSDYKDQAKVYYASPDNSSGKSLQKIISEIAPEYIYLNGLFSKQFTLVPLWLKWRGKISAKIVLAPRGMLKESALAYKPLKKKIFLTLARMMGLSKMVVFQATDVQEKQDVNLHFSNANVIFAPNLPGPLAEKPYSLEKQRGALRIIFVGRIHPIKNLALLFPVLRQLHGKIHFTIIGAKEDQDYWELCSKEIRELPQNIVVSFCGELEHKQIMFELNRHHLMVLPTRGENFGHAIFEALSVGRPVLVSDQTPWRNLEARKAGWDLPLSDPGTFLKSLEIAVNWDQREFEDWSESALAVAKQFVTESEVKASYLHLFN